jgi:hypothetical protein
MNTKDIKLEVMKRKMIKPVQLYAIAFHCNAGTKEVSTVSPEIFRPSKILTNISGPGLAWINGIYLGSDPDNQIIGGPKIDTWIFSQKWLELEKALFLKEHEIEHLSLNELQRYLDVNGLSLPDVPKLELPTVARGEMIRITGNFPVPFQMSFLGYV